MGLVLEDVGEREVTASCVRGEGDWGDSEVRPPGGAWVDDSEAVCMIGER